MSDEPTANKTPQQVNPLSRGDLLQLASIVFEFYHLTEQTEPVQMSLYEWTGALAKSWYERLMQMIDEQEPDAQ